MCVCDTVEGPLLLTVRLLASLDPPCNRSVFLLFFFVFAFVFVASDQMNEIKI